MSKKSKYEKPKCVHGLTPVYVSGCYQCVSEAMALLTMSQAYGFTAHELAIVLADTFATKANLAEAVQRARDEIKVQDRSKAGVKP